MGEYRPIRVVIVDDEALMRAGIRLMIDGIEGITVVGEARDGDEALTQVEELDPDVVLMDLRMPNRNGIEATQSLVDAGHRAAVVVLTAFDTDELLLGAFRAGALSFLLKDSQPETVISTIRDAARGEGRVSPRALVRLVTLAEDGGAGVAGEHGVSARLEGLTEREWQVGRCVARGLTNAEICAALFVSLATVKTHLGNLFAKLHVTNRVQLALRILEHEELI